MSNYINPEWPKSALITIDTQYDTHDGQPFEVPGTSAILPQMKKLAQVYRAADRPIVHIVRIYKADGSNVDLCRKERIEQGEALVLAGTSGCQLASELLPRADIELDTELLLTGGIQTLGSEEVVIYKPRWGAFYDTPLEQYLQSKGVSTLVFSGCNFPNCPRTSIYEASERDFRIVLVQDAISGLYNRGKVEMQNIGVQILSTDPIVEAVNQFNLA